MKGIALGCGVVLIAEQQKIELSLHLGGVWSEMIILHTHGVARK